MSDSMDNIKRGHEFIIIEQVAMRLLWKTLSNTPKDGVWREFNAPMVVQNKKFDVKCLFRLINDFFSYKDLEIRLDGKLVNREEDVPTETITLHLDGAI